MHSTSITGKIRSTSQTQTQIFYIISKCSFYLIISIYHFFCQVSIYHLSNFFFLNWQKWASIPHTLQQNSSRTWILLDCQMMTAADPSGRPQKHFLKLDAGEETALGPIFLNIGAGVEGQDVGIVYRHRAAGWDKARRSLAGDAALNVSRWAQRWEERASQGIEGERENTHLFWLRQVIAFLFFCPLVSNKLRAGGEQDLKKNHVNPRKPPLVDEERQHLSLV